MKINIQKWKNTILSLLLILVVIVGVQVMKNFYSQIYSEYLGENFATYWASGRLLLAGQNPYSPEDLFALQKSVGWTRERPLLTYNPPWAFPFVLPFCMKNYAMSKFLWLLFNLALVIFSIISLWRFYAGKVNLLWVFCLFVTFFPILFMLKRGQIVAIILLGVTAFLYFEKYRQNWLAGAALMLMAVKPHIIYLFWLALLLWVLDQRNWRVAFAGGFVFLGGIIFSLIYDSNIVSEYLSMLADQSPVHIWLTPTIGTYLRLIFGGQRYWLQFTPTMIGALWFFYYWRKHRRTWQWDQHMPLILLVSLMTTYYVWANDYIMALPAVIQASVWVSHSRRILSLSWVVMVYLLVNAFTWGMGSLITQNEQWSIWIILAFLLIYLTLRKQIGKDYSFKSLLGHGNNGP